MNEYIEKLKKVVKGRLVVYIDAANLERSIQNMWVNPKDIPDNYRHMTEDLLRWAADYKKFKDFFSSLGDLQGVRFYSASFGTDSHTKFLYFLKKRLDFKLTTKPLKEYGDHTLEIPHRKANFDVEMAVDATFTLKSFDTFILFSGDCDFEYLVKFLRGQGKMVIGVSRSGHIAKELPPACTHYFDIADFRKEILQILPKKAKSPTP